MYIRKKNQKMLRPYHFIRCISAMLLTFCLASCEKEIPMDYHQVESLYVAEARLTQNGASVRLTTTQDMTDNRRNAHNVDDATIVLSSNGETLDTLRHAANGNYQSDVKGVAGFTYDIDIRLADGRHFASSSTMQQAPEMTGFRFVWKDIIGERMLFADLQLQDIAHEANYYFMHLYRNGVGYRWAVMTDDHNPGKELQQLFSCTTERDMNRGDSDALQDGDRIRVEIRSIDRVSYDYLYSMQVMDNAGTNPIANFSGGCLGFFSAYHVVNYNTVFRRSEVETDD